MNADANRVLAGNGERLLGSRAFGWSEGALGWLSSLFVGVALRGHPLLGRKCTQNNGGGHAGRRATSTNAQLDSHERAE
jgi:hypothetical protein